MAAVRLRDLSQTAEERLSSGHRACAGCTCATAVRQVALSAENPIVVSFATGCLEVATTIYPYTAWNIPFIHSAFENSAATISGVETAYRALKKKGKIEKDVKFIAFGGDGGTYDIGLQSLSGALERGHDFLYVCYDNQAYMNTGIQRSGATPFLAATSTSPAGDEIPGKQQFRKDLTAIVAAHNIPYLAQTSVHNWRDLITKVRKALDTKGPTFLNILAPCFRGWRFPAEQAVDIARMAVDTCFWPLFEIENGEYNLTYKPRRKKKPVEEWLQRQGRFSHLFKPEKDEEAIAKIQEDIDKQWNKLLQLSGEQE
jgi:pyruvate ferredoxin oxidoreductase beta subunit